MTTSANANAPTIRLTIPARAEYITLCRLALTGIGRLRELSAELLADLKLALTEAASYSVRHVSGANQDVAGVAEWRVGRGWLLERAPGASTTSLRSV